MTSLLINLLVGYDAVGQAIVFRGLPGLQQTQTTKGDRLRHTTLPRAIGNVRAHAPEMLTLKRRTTVLPQDLSVCAIFIGSNDTDYQHLHRIFRMMNWDISHVPTLQHGLKKAGLDQTTHFLYEHVQGDNREWVEALQAADSLPHMPSFILVSRLGDERLWAEVLNRGGFDLLLTPFDSIEVTRVIRAAREYTLRHTIELEALAG